MNFDINKMNLPTPPTWEKVGEYRNQTVVINRGKDSSFVYLLKKGQKFNNDHERIHYRSELIVRISEDVDFNNTITLYNIETASRFPRQRLKKEKVNPDQYSLKQEAFASFALDRHNNVEIPEVTQLDKLKSLINSQVESVTEKPISYSVLVFLNGMIISQGVEELINMYHGNPNFFEALLFYIQN